MDLDEISKRIDAGENPDAMRLALAEKVLECLTARGDLLSPMERVHFGLAIELLPSTFLRMTWALVYTVCTESVANAKDRKPRESQPIPTLDELHVKLNDTLESIRRRIA